MVKLATLLLSSTVRGISVRAKDFLNLKIYGKLAGLSNKFEPSMVFDPSEFEGPGFFHTISKDLTEQNAPFCVLLKKKIREGGWQT